MTPTQRENALLADGLLWPGNRLHLATLAGKPGYSPRFARCCQSDDGCRCSLERRTVVLSWKRLTAPQRRLFPVGHPFRNPALT